MDSTADPQGSRISEILSTQPNFESASEVDEPPSVSPPPQPAKIDRRRGPRTDAQKEQLKLARASGVKMRAERKAKEESERVERIAAATANLLSRRRLEKHRPPPVDTSSSSSSSSDEESPTPPARHHRRRVCARTKLPHTHHEARILNKHIFLLQV